MYYKLNEWNLQYFYMDICQKYIEKVYTDHWGKTLFFAS